MVSADLVCFLLFSATVEAVFVVFGCFEIKFYIFFGTVLLCV